MRMLLQLKDQAEIVIVINAADIEKNKVRGDLGITYDVRRAAADRRVPGHGPLRGQRGASPATAARPRRMPSSSGWRRLGIRYTATIRSRAIPPMCPISSATRATATTTTLRPASSLVVVTAPGPGSGKMATCLSQLYHEHKRGIQAGYAKFETFPIWNLPLKHPVNLAYEAATADLNDVNMIDPFHLEAYGETTVNYNRDVEIFPVLKATFDIDLRHLPLPVPRPIWASIWPATASSMTTLPACQPKRRSCAATLPGLRAMLLARTAPATKL